MMRKVIVHTVQPLTDHGVPSAMKNLVKAAAFKALCVERDENPYALALYLHAAVGNLFLQSAEGRRQLRAADEHGKAVLNASVRAIQDQSHGAFAAYGWTLIRKLHPDGPGQLHLWGKEENRPAEDSPGVHLMCWSRRRLIPCADHACRWCYHRLQTATFPQRMGVGSAGPTVQPDRCDTGHCMRPQGRGVPCMGAQTNRAARIVHMHAESTVINVVPVCGPTAARQPRCLQGDR